MILIIVVSLLITMLNKRTEHTQVAVVLLKALELHQLAVVEDPANSLRNISLLAT